MAYTALPNKAVGDTITQPNWANIQANFAASAVAIAAVKGDLAIATGVTALAVLTVGADGTTLIPDAAEVTGMRYQIQPSVGVYAGGDITPAGVNWETVDWTHERWDTDAMWALGADSSKLIVPANGAGIYTFSANLDFDTAALAGAGQWNYGIRVRFNDTATIAQDFKTIRNRDGNPTRTTFSLSSEYPLDDDDFIELQFLTDGGENVLYLAEYSPEFRATWLRPFP